MAAPSRRSFLQTTAAGVAAATSQNLARASAAANEKFVLGVIGPGGQGVNLVNSFAALPAVEFAYVCDVDDARAQQAAKSIKGSPKVVKDMRQVFDDKSVDAVIIATPDHWHAPATILAVNAGKHVYVEKPCSHNIREGRLMVEAARRNSRIVQVGTQSRSTPHIMQAMQRLREGAIGKVLIAKAWNSQRRSTIGRAKPTDPPQGLDYDLWVGPAPMRPYQANLMHSIWRWWYDFGTGDAGNDGVHDIDIARWGLGVSQQPDYVAGGGGKYFFDDDMQFPDTQYVAFEYDRDKPVGERRQLVFEMRIWAPYVQEEYENGNAFYGTEGMLLLGKQKGYRLYGPRNKLIEHVPAEGVDATAHHRNFLESIRSGVLPNADIEIGHLSTSLAHLANITARVGRSLKFDRQTEQVVGDDEANKLVRRDYREGHWAVPQGA